MNKFWMKTVGTFCLSKNTCFLKFTFYFCSSLAQNFRCLRSYCFLQSAFDYRTNPVIRSWTTVRQSDVYGNHVASEKHTVLSVNQIISWSDYRTRKSSVIGGLIIKWSLYFYVIPRSVLLLSEGGPFGTTGFEGWWLDVLQWLPVSWDTLNGFLESRGSVPTGGRCKSPPATSCCW